MDDFIRVRRSEYEALKAENIELRSAITALQEELKELRGRLSKDSHNSSKPPSSNGFRQVPHTRNQRKRSGKKPGGQSGHPGSTLTWNDDPDKVEIHYPENCADCGQPFTENDRINDDPDRDTEAAQVVDIPPAKMEYTEHQAGRCRCLSCDAVTVGKLPQGVVDGGVQYGLRIQEYVTYMMVYQLLPYQRTVDWIVDLYGHQVSKGSLGLWQKRCYSALAPVEAAIKKQILDSPVNHADETGVKIFGKRYWLHVLCNRWVTFYAVHKSRGREGMEAIGVIPQFTGTLVHDGYKTYPNQTQCEHSLCNAHHLRELTFIEEEEKHAWATDMKDLILRIKASVTRANERGTDHLEASWITRYESEYATILKRGFEVYRRLSAALPVPTQKKRGRPKQASGKNLLDRFLKQQDEVLAYMYNFDIPFDNNQAERDIRMAKLKQKISGSYRSTQGADIFCRIRSYISTLRKQGISVMDGIDSVVRGRPIMPQLCPRAG